MVDVKLGYNVSISSTGGKNVAVRRHEPAPTKRKSPVEDKTESYTVEMSFGTTNLTVTVLVVNIIELVTVVNTHERFPPRSQTTVRCELRGEEDTRASITK